MLNLIKKHLKKFYARRYKHLFEITEKTKPKNIMEIGIYDGENSLKILEIAKKYNNAREINYYGFDLFESMDKNTYEKEVSKNPLSQKNIYEKLKKTNSNIFLFKGNTLKTLPENYKKLPKMDLIIIDGGHSLETINNDWNYSKKLMHKNTKVLFDDYWNRLNSGCKPLIDSLDRKKYNVKILPIQDIFLKKDGLLKINYALVSLKK
ncbi:MAG: class I SAM-dependent methyltransferase [Candidatus Woesearchaeota archaeon]